MPRVLGVKIFLGVPRIKEHLKVDSCSLFSPIPCQLTPPSPFSSPLYFYKQVCSQYLLVELNHFLNVIFA